jgi:hypothetical protein
MSSSASSFASLLEQRRQILAELLDQRVGAPRKFPIAATAGAKAADG